MISFEMSETIIDDIYAQFVFKNTLALHMQNNTVKRDLKSNKIRVVINMKLYKPFKFDPSTNRKVEGKGTFVRHCLFDQNMGEDG